MFNTMHKSILINNVYTTSKIIIPEDNKEISVGFGQCSALEVVYIRVYVYIYIY